MSLEMPLKKAIRTTQFHLRRLEQLEIRTVSDFLLYFPRTYTDQRQVRNILEIETGVVNTIRGIVKSAKNAPTWRHRMRLVTALISDESASVEAVWFNQSYLEKILKPGTAVMLSGKPKYDAKRGRVLFQNPNIELVGKNQIHMGRIVPVYHETELRTAKKIPGKISSKWIREKLFGLLPFADFFPEYLPETIRGKYGLMPLAEAVKNAHFPESEEKLARAKRRLAFDELFILQLAALHRKYLWRKTAVEGQNKIASNWKLIKSFTEFLPWPLTASQKKSIYEIIKDTEKPFPMSRLLAGDTGSGKTVVAAAACLHSSKAGWQCCVLAPTEILARQHFESFSKMLKNFGVKPALLIGAMNKREKNETVEKARNGEIEIIIGTHALLREKMAFKNLGLAVIDEQHRFGVKQREIIKTYGSPHVLSLTATPIPRTLALILYGDQDISVLDRMPPGRQPVITRIVPEEKRFAAYEWIKKEIEKGRQAFIIFPLIQESEDLDVKAATAEFGKLQNQIFKNLEIGLLHGRMSSQEKQENMNLFATGKIQILVSTAVVEVGVDVPNATIMLIEGAERFGLAQLHQFRGRVGRGSEKSYCFLFPTSKTPQNLKRLHALTKFNSGFKLADLDLQFRGPGEVYGTAQSGIPDLKMATLSDAATIKQAREAADQIINQDPELETHKFLKQKIAEQRNIAVDY